MMQIDQVRSKFNSWNAWLSRKQKKYIHFFSIRNFLFHFENLPNETVKDRVLNVFENYVNEIDDASFEYNASKGYELIPKYINELSEVYKQHLGFKTFLKFPYVIFFSLIGDGLLYFFFYRDADFYFPIVFLLLLVYYLYVKLLFESKKKVYGIFY